LTEKRVALFIETASGSAAVWTLTDPFSMIDHIDILKDGASAVLGRTL